MQSMSPGSRPAASSARCDGDAARARTASGPARRSGARRSRSAGGSTRRSCPSASRDRRCVTTRVGHAHARARDPGSPHHRPPLRDRARDRAALAVALVPEHRARRARSGPRGRCRASAETATPPCRAAIARADARRQPVDLVEHEQLRRVRRARSPRAPRAPPRSGARSRARRRRRRGAAGRRRSSSSSVARNAATRSCGQVADEAHRVGDDHLALAREAQPARGGIERREHRVGDVHVGVGERAQQRALARVRVADDRQDRHVAPRAPLAPRLALRRAAARARARAARRGRARGGGRSRASSRRVRGRRCRPSGARARCRRAGRAAAAGT